MLDVGRQRHLVNAQLVRQTVNFVLQAQFGRLVFDTEVDWLDNSTLGQRRECLDTALRLHMDGTVVVN